MLLKCTMVAVAAATALSSSASGAVITFTDQFLFDAYTTSYAHSTETFSAYSGPYSNPLLGTAGGVNWSATATSGLNVVSGQLSSGATGPMNIAFSGAAVYGVSGNFFATNGGGVVVPSLVLISLSDGTSYLNLIETSTVFVGFVSSGAAISAIEISAQALPGSPSSPYPTVDNLGFAYVPAPGALALLGLAGLVGSRRRR